MRNQRFSILKPPVAISRLLQLLLLKFVLIALFMLVSVAFCYFFNFDFSILLDRFKEFLFFRLLRPLPFSILGVPVGIAIYYFMCGPDIVDAPMRAGPEPSSSVESTARSHQPPVPNAPAATPDYGEQIRQDLKREILDLMCLRVENELRQNGVLEMSKAEGIQLNGDEKALIQEKAQKVLVEIEVSDESNLFDLQDCLSKLQPSHEWHDLNKVIRRTLWPRTPHG